jgi:hypothetical protein
MLALGCDHATPLAPPTGTGGTPVFSTGDNVVPLVSGTGPTYSKNGKTTSLDYTNGLFATVTVCEPGIANCQVIDHLLVDTGSVGLRILESVLTLNLPPSANATGMPLAECTQFVDGDTWGPLVQADVTLGKEVIPALVIQSVGTATFTLPSRCTGTPINDIEGLRANGILGVGLFKEDCGANCSRSPATQVTGGAAYFACAGRASCALASVALDQQLQNPVAMLTEDNNGVIIELPAVAANGTTKVAGAMVLGIGTRENNALGAAVVMTTDRQGFMDAFYPVDGTNHRGFIDSGSNGTFFLTTAKTGIPTCAEYYSDFYCPKSTTTIAMALGGLNGQRTNLSFQVGNASTLFGYTSHFVYGNLAGPMPADPTLPGFDLGLSFHYGRRVFSAIEGQDTPAGKGPYFAL